MRVVKKRRGGATFSCPRCLGRGRVRPTRVLQTRRTSPMAIVRERQCPQGHRTWTVETLQEGTG